MKTEGQIALSKSSATIESTPADGVILFDGVCNLCNGWVLWVIKRDPHRRFRFAPLQSDAADAVLGEHGRAPGLDSIVLVTSGRVFDRSSAVLKVLGRLTFPWPLLTAFLIVPRFIRDFVYDAIARRRYGWFGRRSECMIPTPELMERFLT